MKPNRPPESPEQKAKVARLRGEIEAICAVCPASVRDGSIQTVRGWKEARLKALKAAKARDSSEADLTSCLSNMRRFE